MSSGYTVFIPLKPFMVQYLESRYGQSPISFSGKGKDDERIMVKLSKLLRVPPLAIPKRQPHEVGVTIDLTRITDFDPRRYNYLSPMGESIIYKYIYEKVFLIDYFDWMDEAYDTSDEIKNLITEFCDQRGITEENMQFDTLKKRYYRFRESRLGEMRKKLHGKG